jgi:hypothetical protein
MAISLRDFLGKTATFRSPEGDISGEIIGVGSPQSSSEIRDSTDFFRFSQFLVRCERATARIVIGTQLEASGEDMISVNGTPLHTILTSGKESVVKSDKLKSRAAASSG